MSHTTRGAATSAALAAFLFDTETFRTFEYAISENLFLTDKSKTPNLCFGFFPLACNTKDEPCERMVATVKDQAL